MAALTAGTAVGVGSHLLAATDGAMGQAAHLVLVAGWAWAALAFLAGLAQAARTDSAVMASVSLLAAVIAYYLTKLGQGEYLTADLSDPTGRTTYTSWTGFLSEVMVWCLAAGVFGPLLGLAGNLARNRGLQGLPFRILVPLVAVVDTSLQLRSSASPEGEVAVTTWNVVRLAAVAALVVLVVKTVLARRIGTSAGQERRGD
ncbi:hypothetical protein [Streptomyces mangrovi]|uniref:hypothetical protein n=1 Tax=Streptomyces mangrovi TaxID=1206892 RepID=UPI00399C9590